jgi:thimet oligopeptidase
MTLIDTTGFNAARVTPEQVAGQTSAAIGRARAGIDDITALGGERTVATTLRALETCKILLENYATQLHFFTALHRDEAVRDAARTALQELDAFTASHITLNTALYEAVAAITDMATADQQTQRMHADLMRMFRRSGADKDDETRERVAEIKDRITGLQLAFEKNAAEISEMWVSEQALTGVPDKTLEGFTRNEDGQVRVTTSYPEILPVLQYGDDERTRERASRLFNTQPPENGPVLREIIELRSELASLLGNRTWAEYDVEDVMTKTPETVETFFHVLDRSTKARYDAEIRALTEALEADTGREVLRDFDVTYYREKVKEQRFDLRPKEVMEYFPFRTVLEGIHGVYERLFGIRFEAVDASTLDLWADDGIYVYDIYEDDELLGRAYLDMHPRDGKYGHAACGAIVPGVAGVQLPEIVLMCNFPQPSADNTALLTFPDVKTWFHEFGHGLHQLFGGKTDWIDFSGTNTERDFVEAPSQLLENWLGDASVLQQIGRHYESGEPIPANMVEQIRQAEEYGSGWHVRRQLVLSRFSFEIYRREPEDVDFAALWDEISAEYGTIPRLPETHIETRFGHIVAGYNSMYYTYMWSLAISKHLLRAFDQDDLMDPEPARRYRELILAPGGSRDAADMIADFTGSFDVEEIGAALEEWLTTDPDSW